MRRLIDETADLGKSVGQLSSEQSNKLDLNKKIFDGMRRKGNAYNLEEKKAEVTVLIKKQEDIISQVEAKIKKVRHLLSLVIYMEQATLAIHTSRKRDDLSSMIDIHTMPVEKFKRELDHVKMLDSSFEIMKLELEKQINYVKAFDFDPSTLDENYFYQSEKTESRLFEQEIVNVTQLRTFCDDLHMMIRRRYKKSKQLQSDSDRVAAKMMQELQNIKITHGFMALSAYSFINKLVNKNIQIKHNRQLTIFYIVFLLSRLKKYKPKVYYSILRRTILCYNLLTDENFTDEQKTNLAGAMLLSRITDTRTDVKNDEIHTLHKYSKHVNQLF